MAGQKWQGEAAQNAEGARRLIPAVAALKFCVSAADSDTKVNPVARKRLRDMLEFVETLEGWYAQMLTVPKPKLAGLIRLGTRIVNFLPGGRAK